MSDGDRSGQADKPAGVGRGHAGLCPVVCCVCSTSLGRAWVSGHIQTSDVDRAAQLLCHLLPTETERYVRQQQHDETALVVSATRLTEQQAGMGGVHGALSDIGSSRWQ